MSEDTGLDDYHATRARLAAERTGRRGGSRRWLMLFGIIIAGIISVGVWLKPPVEQMREGVEEGLREYAKLNAKPGEAAPEVSHSESHDWGIFVAHTAQVGEKTFSCWGGFKVTVCNLPGE
jgi:hypothetical protein